MKRSGFSRPAPMRTPRQALVPRNEPARATMRPSLRFVESITKDTPVRSEKYLRAVASLPCWRCGIQGHTQACHGDEGKGMGLKACDLTAWPGCGPHDGLIGCHAYVGSTGKLGRDERRRLEQQAAADTQVMLIEKSQGDHKLRKVLVAVGLVK